MKKRIPFFLLLALLGSFLAVGTAAAQTGTPPLEATPAGPLGRVTGDVIFKVNGKPVKESLEVMLHVLDEGLQDTGMTHAKSEPDGSFEFSEVPFAAGTQFAVMATYEGMTYYSEVEPADMQRLEVSLEVPVYESTSELSGVKVDQLHVIFGLAEDGLETKEIYILSNTGDRTVKDVYKLEADKSATLKFPLPEDADFVFFQPDDQDRFVKLEGGFADTYPLTPGNQPSQIMASYLVPYSGKRTYSLTAPVTIGAINLLVPEASGLSLQGPGLSGPEPMTLQSGDIYQVYSLSELKAGETLKVTLKGKGALAASSTDPRTALAGAFLILGAAALGAGLWWWKRNGRAEDPEAQPAMDDSPAGLDQIIEAIARLDQAHEDGQVDTDEYARSRTELRKRARALLEEPEQKH